MKTLPMTLWVLAGLAVNAAAQTNTPAPVSPGPAATPQGLVTAWSEVDIKANQATFDMRSNTVVFWDTVRVKTPSATMTCEYLIGKCRGRSLSSFERIVAETNVVLVVTNKAGQRFDGLAAKMVYTSTISGGTTNEAVELMGLPQPVVWSDLGTNKADIITYDITRGTIAWKNPQATYLPPPKGAGTNAPSGAGRTNSVPPP
jgi:lipopolysaccharide export system protein LptA